MKDVGVSHWSDDMDITKYTWTIYVGTSCQLMNELVPT
jgi:hypothetical protein